jgi:hypothetical protein
MTNLSDLVIIEIVRLVDSVPADCEGTLPAAYLQATEMLAALGEPVRLEPGAPADADALRVAIDNALLRYVFGEYLSNSEVATHRDA